MELEQAPPRGLDEPIGRSSDGAEWLALDAGLNQIEVWSLRLEASGVPELGSIADGLGRLENSLRSDEVAAGIVGGTFADRGGRGRDLASTDVGRDDSDRLEGPAGPPEREGTGSRVEI